MPLSNELTPDSGTIWRRKADGSLREVVRVYRERVQTRKAGATNLKSTNWLDLSRFAELYEPADAPPPPTLADHIRSVLAIPGNPACEVTVKCGFPWEEGTIWAPHAVEFARRADNVRWKWMNVPENAKRNRQNGWFVLTLFGEIDGVKIELHGGSGWAKERADLLTTELRAAKVRDEESRTPLPFAYEGASA